GPRCLVYPAPKLNKRTRLNWQRQRVFGTPFGDKSIPRRTSAKDFRRQTEPSYGSSRYPRYWPSWRRSRLSRIWHRESLPSSNGFLQSCFSWNIWSACGRRGKVRDFEGYKGGFVTRSPRLRSSI